jgi:hypothetical protein
MRQVRHQGIRRGQFFDGVCIGDGDDAHTGGFPGRAKRAQKMREKKRKTMSLPKMTRTTGKRKNP